MARLRYNGLVAELAGSGLTNSATSITFAAALTHSGGTNVPTITGSDYIPLTLLDSDGVPKEIVYLTAYTAAATTGTITRGRESTTGVSHSAGAVIVHAPTVQDHRLVAVAAVRTTVQSVSDSTDTAVSFTDADEYDTDSLHSTSTNPSRIVTVPAGMGGVWRFIGTASYAANGAGIRRLGWALNGTTLGTAYGHVAQAGVSATDLRQTSAIDLLLVDGDYVELKVFQSAGVALNVSARATAQRLGSP